MLIHYATGNEHSPTDRAGRFTLELDADGSVRLAHHAWLTGQVRSWSARVGPEVAAAVLADLRDAGFPALPRRHLMPDERTRTLHLPGLGTAVLPWDLGSVPPGCARALRTLDALVDATTPPKDTA
ncbi:hypothetical protein [Streptomyces mangrovisoli]|uniref:Uncharacterized protein n=1 Tax=Streptomyces mangrovisoli TaxID=1428628 RepID=A0A1J4NW89_9ACTN|nr:hypothetical protein [Streptomyces mangrovisoli]OIJ66560.1 hypothetical protein WN71_017870 [Streptomyces mangrovisoli]